MTTATKPKEDDDNNNNNGSNTIGRRDSVHMTEALQRKTIIDELDGDTTLIMNVIQRAGMTSEHTNQNPGEGSAGLHRKKTVLDHMTQQLLSTSENMVGLSLSILPLFCYVIILLLLLMVTFSLSFLF